MAFSFNISHHSRHTPWGGADGSADIVMLGVDWSAAAFQMALAYTLGGTPAITLPNASAGSQGVSATYDATYVDPDTGATVGATIIRPQINEVTFEALTWPADTTQPLVMAFDFLVTPSGEPQFVWFYGNMTIHPGVGD
jgi:hypothetical protein